METKKLRMLAIDDEFAALSKMKLMLSAYGECELATSGTQALELVKASFQTNRYFDLIAIDIELPDYNGIDLSGVIQIIENKYRHKSVKIIVSASGTTENVIRAAQNKCADFLVKPVKRELLKQKLIDLGLI